MACEFSYVVAGFGASVTMLARSRLLSRDEPEAGALIAGVLIEGLTIRDGASATSVEQDGQRFTACLEDSDPVRAARLLIATGLTYRRPCRAAGDFHRSRGGIGRTPRVGRTRGGYQGAHRTKRDPAVGAGLDPHRRRRGFHQGACRCRPRSRQVRYPRCAPNAPTIAVIHQMTTAT